MQGAWAISGNIFTQALRSNQEQTSTGPSKFKSNMHLKVAKLEAYPKIQYLICWPLCELEIYLLELHNIKERIKPWV